MSSFVVRARWRLVVLTLTSTLGMMAAAHLPTSQAGKSKAKTTTPAPTPTPTPAPTGGRLRFGIYPWGAAGAVGSIAPSVPDNADQSLRAVQQLRGTHPLVVHIYGDYTGISTTSGDNLISEATWWSANGLQIAAVLRYRPADASKAAGYVAWVQSMTHRLAALPGTVSIQIANEPNNPSAGAGDGSYPGVITAIATAVPAARNQLIADSRSSILVGFNWAAGTSPTTTEPMWAALKQAGGTAFTQAVGFVAVNVYPGTWSPPAADSVPTATQIDATLRTTLNALRNQHMPAAGIGTTAAIVVGETGYPTTPTRTEATQDMVLNTTVSTIDATRTTYGTTDLYWFALRDGNTSSGQLENGYGLLHDNYTPKPAYTSLQQAIATVGN